MFKTLYSVGLGVAALGYLPKILSGKYRDNFKLRLGLGIPSLKSTAPLRIWVHAVSLGEVKAIVPFIKRLKKDHPEAFIIISTITATGQSEARRSLPEADRHIYLPFDFCVRKFVKEAKPHHLVLCETDFWFNFLDEAKAAGAKITLINGKISEKSYGRFKIFKGYANKIFSLIDLSLTQSELYKERFETLGLKSEVGGNIKLDSDPGHLLPEDLGQLKNSLGLSDEPVLVIGSTHNPEEEMFLNALDKVWKAHPQLKVLLVPRHPERFEEIAKLLPKPFNRFSQKERGAPLMLIDAMGQLKHCYQIATVAAVAGSWTPKVGGHNILEPSFYAKPVLFGPYMHSQPDFLELMHTYKAGVQITSESIADTLIELLNNDEKRKGMGERGYQLTQESKGALNRSYNAFLKLLQTSNKKCCG